MLPFFVNLPSPAGNAMERLFVQVFSLHEPHEQPTRTTRTKLCQGTTIKIGKRSKAIYVLMEGLRNAQFGSKNM